jgi:hypothetical protein
MSLVVSFWGQNFLIKYLILEFTFVLNPQSSGIFNSWNYYPPQDRVWLFSTLTSYMQMILDLDGTLTVNLITSKCFLLYILNIYQLPFIWNTGGTVPKLYVRRNYNFLVQSLLPNIPDTSTNEKINWRLIQK